MGIHILSLSIYFFTFAHRGALYGLSSNRRHHAFLRPPNRARGLINVSFVGGTTHPCGGVSLVALGGKRVARLVERDG